MQAWLHAALVEKKVSCSVRTSPVLPFQLHDVTGSIRTWQKRHQRIGQVRLIARLVCIDRLLSGTRMLIDEQSLVGVHRFQPTEADLHPEVRLRLEQFQPGVRVRSANENHIRTLTKAGKTKRGQRS